MPSRSVLRKELLRKEIKIIYHKSKGRYGSPRIAKELNMNGIKVSKVFVVKIMREEHLRSIVRKKYKVTTDSSHKYPIVENALQREFTVKEENKVLVSDLTYVRTREKVGFI